MSYIDENAIKLLNISKDMKNELYMNYRDNNYKNINDLFKNIIKCVYDDIKQSDTLRTFILNNKDISDFLYSEEMNLITKYFNIKNMFDVFTKCKNENKNYIKFLISLNTYDLMGDKNTINKKMALKKIINNYVINETATMLELPEKYKKLIINEDYEINYDILSEIKLYSYKKNNQ